MSEPHVITALARKRGQLAGEIEATQGRLRDLIASLEAIDTAILVFDPDYRVVGIKPIAYRLHDKGRAPRGEMARMVLDVIREARKPLTAPEIVSIIMGTKGMDQDDRRAVKHMSVKVNAALRRHRKNGALRSENGPDVHLLWMAAT